MLKNWDFTKKILSLQKICSQCTDFAVSESNIKNVQFYCINNAYTYRVSHEGGPSAKSLKVVIFYDFLLLYHL